MLWGILTHFWEGGIPVILDFIMGNLMWVFIFAALAYYLLRKDMVLIGIGVVAIYMWSSLQWADVLDFVILVGAFLSINYITRLAVILFAEHVPALKGKIPHVIIVSFVAILFIYNIFLR